MKWANEMGIEFPNLKVRHANVPLSDIIREVKIILDENITESFIEGDPDQLQLKDHIEARILDAVRNIHEAAGSEMLDDGLPIPTSGESIHK